MRNVRGAFLAPQAAHARSHASPMRWPMALPVVTEGRGQPDPPEVKSSGHCGPEVVLSP